MAPGGVGVTNTTNVQVVGNVIRQSGREGITLRDPNNEGLATGGAVVSDNLIVSALRASIQILERGKTLVSNNVIDATTQRGVQILNTVSQRESITIIGNNISNTSLSAIDCSYVKGLIVSNNNVYKQALNGVIIDNTSQVKISGNYFVNSNKASGSEGIKLTANVTDGCIISDNFITDNEYGIEANSICQLTGNRVFDNTNNYAGVYGMTRTLAINSATPSVDSGSSFITANTLATTVSNFTGGLDGQLINIVVNDSSTTFDFSGSSLKGNNGVDYTASQYDSLFCVYNATLGVWLCNVNQG